jgi:hypothetical protein
MQTSNVKDLAAGALFLAFGVAFLYFAQSYPLGTAQRMGPAYFPVVLSIVLIGIGLATMARALVRQGEPIRQIAAKPLALVTLSVILFGLLVQRAGVGIAVAALVLASAAASRRFSLGPSVALAVLLALFSVAVFVKGLGLPFAAFPWSPG